MKKIYLLILSLFFINTAFSQVAIEWQKTYGGSGEEGINSIIQTPDGGFIAVGSSTSNDGDVNVNYGFDDVWVVKLDPYGNIQWEKSYGGSSGDGAYDILQTNDGGYIIAAQSNSIDYNVTNNYGDVDCWIFKIDSLGNLIWEKSFGTGTYDTSLKITKGYNNEYVISGRSDEPLNGWPSSWNYYTVKIDTVGNLQWQKFFGGTAPDWSLSNIATSDGGFIFSGNTRSNNLDVTGNHGASDGWLVKVNANGNMEWQKCLGGTLWEDIFCINKTFDGGYIFSGASNSNDGDVSGNHGSYDYWIVKIDSLANIQWQKCLGGSLYEKSNYIHQTFDGGYITVGSSYSNDQVVSGNKGGADIWVVKIDTIGNIQWEINLGGSDDDFARIIKQININDYIIAGHTYSNDQDVTGNNGLSDAWIIKISDPNSIFQYDFKINYSIFPNPTTGELNISFKLDKSSDVEIELFNSLGQSVKTFSQKKLTAGENKINFSTDNITPGFYHVKFTVDGSGTAKKIIKIRN